MNNHIIVKDRDGIRTVTINRPDKKNALTHAMYQDMADALAEYDADPDLRALIFTGAGDMLTAGNDLADFADGNFTLDFPVVGFLRALIDAQKPILCAVNGDGIGIGTTMLLLSDLVFIAEGAHLSVPFAGLGLVPEAGASILLPATVGRAIAQDMFLTGRRLSATEAVQNGIASRIYTPDQLMAETQIAARQIARTAPNAIRRTKALVHHDRAQIHAQLDTELKWFADQLGSDEFRESLAAKLEKRPPNFD